MAAQLSFENSETKEMLSKYDIKFFLKQNIEEENYDKSNVDALYSSYEIALQKLKAKYKHEKRQSNYFLEGQVRKMFSGGLLPALFHLDENRGHTIYDFEGVGEDLAYFKLWQCYYKKKVIVNKAWDWIIKTGSILGILLSILKVWETLK